MRRVDVVDASTGDRLDTVTLADTGELSYASGVARDLVEGLIRAAGRRAGGGRDALVRRVIDLLAAGWSNGYASTQAQPR